MSSLTEAAAQSDGFTLEAAFTRILAEVVGAEPISADSDFFDDLGADSMVMAHFCARVRKRTDLPSVSIKDVYRHPTIRSLVAALPAVAPPAAEPSGPPVAEAADGAPRAGTRQYVVCGVLQLLVFLGYSYLAAVVLTRAYGWVSAGSGVLAVYLRSVLAGAAVFLFLLTVPVLAKWALIGRWKVQEIPVWGLAYVRFWLVKTLVQRNPLILVFVGSPLYPLDLRALGAKVGRGVAIFSLHVPVCTDLLTIGDGAVIRKDAFLNCYRAHAGVIQTGAVSLGKDALVGEMTVLDIETSLGDGAQLGHSSALHAGQAVPSAERWHGSPAQPTEVDYRTVAPADCGPLRRAGYSVLQLGKVLAVYLPLAVGGSSLVFREMLRVEALLDPATASLTSGSFYGNALIAASVLYFGALLVGLLVVVTIPRLLHLAIEPGRVYRLYGVHYSLHRLIARMTNPKAFPFLFGDSSYIVGYLRGIGYDLSQVRQTGSNFGLAVKHENPFLSSVGSGTMVADGLSMMNADYSSSSFRLSRTSIGPDNFLGNKVAYPPQGRTGANCLLATKVMVPMDGQIRENVGLPGSPSFELPRKVERDSDLDLKSGGELRVRLRAKNRHNLVTIAVHLLVRWVFVFAMVLIGSTAFSLYTRWGTWVVALASVLTVFFVIGYFVLVDRALLPLRALKPQGCSIYGRDFWRHERLWKVSSVGYLMALNGTPFKNVAWRLLGVRIGRRVFDDGCMLTERPFTTIGDECTLNAGTAVQCHSQEDGAFKSDLSALGARCTLDVGAFVHYGVTVGDGAVLAADSFLMKGEDVPPDAHWGGNPARELRADAPAVQVHRDSALVSGR